jgi:hypothetical protein
VNLNRTVALALFQYSCQDTACYRFPGQSFDITDPPVQALSGKSREHDLSHVKPTTLLGSEMKLELPGKFKSLLGRKGFIKRTCRMGVEIILNNFK